MLGEVAQLGEGQGGPVFEPSVWHEKVTPRPLIHQ